MNPTRLMRLDGTITRLEHDGSADRYGDPQSEESTIAVKCWLEQTRRTEDTVSSDTQEQTWTLYLPPDTEVSGSDRIEVNGDTFELFGPPWLATHPRTQQPTHIEATLTKVD